MNFKNLTNRLLGNKTPKDGEVFESLTNVDISYITSHFAPYTGGDKAVLKTGERVVVHGSRQNRPTSVYCTPLNYEDLEKDIVAKDEIDTPTYAGYTLYIKTSDLNNKFKKIDLMPIKYIQGDATNPADTKTKIIIHVCNDVGGWGKGFVMAISKRWKQPEAEYRNWFKSKELAPNDNVQFERIESRDKYSNEKKFELGNVQFVKVSSDLWVANMIAQVNTKPDKDGLPPIRYVFVKECLERVTEFAKRTNASVHMPRIGCGLAGGQWSEIEPLINHTLIANGIDTTVYDF